MIGRDEVRAAVLNAVETLNQTLAADAQLALDGHASLTALDSLAVTNLLVAVEEAAQEILHVNVSMTDERTLELIMSMEATPLRSVETLIDYVASLVDETAS